MSREYNEPISELSGPTRDFHRAISSLIEELEAINWYHQRVETCNDEVLQSILAHNRDEEVEHAAMLMEWLRRHHQPFDTELRNTLFTNGPIVGSHGNGDADPGSKGLNIGSLKEGAI